MSSQWRCREHDAHVRRCLARRASLKLTQDFAGLLPGPTGATVASAFGPIHICSREGYRVTLGLVKLKRTTGSVTLLSGSVGRASLGQIGQDDQ